MFYKKVLFDKKTDKRWLVSNLDSEYSCSHGSVSIEDLNKSSGLIKTNTGYELFIWDANFYDNFSKLKRGPALIISKDIGAIVIHTLPKQNGVIVDGGSGCGALACSMGYLFPNANIFSYDNREEHIKIANKNKQQLDISNVEFIHGDLQSDIKQNEIDLLTVDMPNPELILNSAGKKLNTGCFMVCYLPCITQVQTLVESLNDFDCFYHQKTIELTEREWNVEGKKVRPKPVSIGHTAFLVFIKKIK